MSCKVRYTLSDFSQIYTVQCSSSVTQSVWKHSIHAIWNADPRVSSICGHFQWCSFIQNNTLSTEYWAKTLRNWATAAQLTKLWTEIYTVRQHSFSTAYITKTVWRINTSMFIPLSDFPSGAPSKTLATDCNTIFLPYCPLQYKHNTVDTQSQKFGCSWSNFILCWCCKWKEVNREHFYTF